MNAYIICLKDESLDECLVTCTESPGGDSGGGCVESSDKDNKLKNCYHWVLTSTTIIMDLICEL